MWMRIVLLGEKQQIWFESYKHVIKLQQNQMWPLFVGVFHSLSFWFFFIWFKFQVLTVIWVITLLKRFSFSLIFVHSLGSWTLIFKIFVLLSKMTYWAFKNKIANDKNVNGNGAKWNAYHLCSVYQIISAIGIQIKWPSSANE